VSVVNYQVEVSAKG